MKRSSGFYGWKLVGVLFALDFLNMGVPLFGGAVINTYMLKRIPMSRSTYGLGFTLINLFIGLPATLVVATILKWGTRAAFLIGSAFLSAGALFLALFASKPWHYLVAFGIIIATGICFSTIIPVTTLAARWFRQFRGRAMAIPLSASGFAGFVCAPLFDKLLAADAGNWRHAWLLIAAIPVISGIIAFALVSEHPSDCGQTVDGSPEDLGAAASLAIDQRITRYSWTPQEAYRTSAYWLVLLGGIACQFPYFFFVAHWILHLRAAHFAAATAAWAMGFFTLGAIAGRLVGGWLMDKIAARFAFISGLLCYFAGSLLAIAARPQALALAIAAGMLYGIAFGWTFVCLNTVTAHFFGPAAFPKLNGMMLLLTAIICSPAGLLGGEIFDKFGSYTQAFELNMLLVALGILALSFAKPPHPPRISTVELAVPVS
jgi:MFS family permease